MDRKKGKISVDPRPLRDARLARREKIRKAVAKNSAQKERQVTVKSLQQNAASSSSQAVKESTSYSKQDTSAAELRRLATTQGFWSERHARDSLSFNRSNLTRKILQKQFKKKKNVKAKSTGCNINKTVSSSSDTSVKGKKQATKKAIEPDKHVKVKSDPTSKNCPLAELRRLQTTEGFWSPSFTTLVSPPLTEVKSKNTKGFRSPNLGVSPSMRHSSRDVSPASSNSSLDRVTRRGSGRSDLIDKGSVQSEDDKPTQPTTHVGNVNPTSGGTGRRSRASLPAGDVVKDKSKSLKAKSQTEKAEQKCLPKTKSPVAQNEQKRNKSTEHKLVKRDSASPRLFAKNSKTSPRTQINQNKEKEIITLSQKDSESPSGRRELSLRPLRKDKEQLLSSTKKGKVDNSLKKEEPIIEKRDEQRDSSLGRKEKKSHTSLKDMQGNTGDKHKTVGSDSEMEVDVHLPSRINKKISATKQTLASKKRVKSSKSLHLRMLNRKRVMTRTQRELPSAKRLRSSVPQTKPKKGKDNSLHTSPTGTSLAPKPGATRISKSESQHSIDIKTNTNSNNEKSNKSCAKAGTVPRKPKDVTDKVKDKALPVDKSSSQTKGEMHISDLLQSPELKRLKTTDGFWSPPPEIGAVINSSPHRLRHGKRQKSPPKSPTHHQSSLLEHRKKKLKSLKKKVAMMTQKLSVATKASIKPESSTSSKDEIVAQIKKRFVLSATKDIKSKKIASVVTETEKSLGKSIQRSLRKGRKNIIDLKHEQTEKESSKKSSSKKNSTKPLNVLVDKKADLPHDGDKSEVEHISPTATSSFGNIFDIMTNSPDTVAHTLPGVEVDYSARGAKDGEEKIKDLKSSERIKKVKDSEHVEQIGNSDKVVEEVMDFKKAEDLEDPVKIEIKDSGKCEQMKVSEPLDEAEDSKLFEDLKDLKKIEELKDLKQSEEVKDSQTSDEVTDSGKDTIVHGETEGMEDSEQCEVTKDSENIEEMTDSGNLEGTKYCKRSDKTKDVENFEEVRDSDIDEQVKDSENVREIKDSDIESSDEMKDSKKSEGMKSSEDVEKVRDSKKPEAINIDGKAEEKTEDVNNSNSEIDLNGSDTTSVTGVCLDSVDISETTQSCCIASEEMVENLEESVDKVVTTHNVDDQHDRVDGDLVCGQRNEKSDFDDEMPCKSDDDNIEIEDGKEVISKIAKSTSVDTTYDTLKLEGDAACKAGTIEEEHSSENASIDKEVKLGDSDEISDSSSLCSKEKDEEVLDPKLSTGDSPSMTISSDLPPSSTEVDSMGLDKQAAQSEKTSSVDQSDTLPDEKTEQVADDKVADDDYGQQKELHINRETDVNDTTCSDNLAENVDATTFPSDMDAEVCDLGEASTNKMNSTDCVSASETNLSKSEGVGIESHSSSEGNKTIDNSQESQSLPILHPEVLSEAPENLKSYSMRERSVEKSENKTTELKISRANSKTLAKSPERFPKCALRKVRKRRHNKWRRGVLKKYNASKYKLPQRSSSNECFNEFGNNDQVPESSGEGKTVDGAATGNKVNVGGVGVKASNNIDTIKKRPNRHINRMLKRLTTEATFGNAPIIDNKTLITRTKRGILPLKERALSRKATLSHSVRGRGRGHGARGRGARQNSEPRVGSVTGELSIKIPDSSSQGFASLPLPVLKPLEFITPVDHDNSIMDAPPVLTPQFPLSFEVSAAPVLDDGPYDEVVEELVDDTNWHLYWSDDDKSPVKKSSPVKDNLPSTSSAVEEIQQPPPSQTEAVAKPFRKYKGKRGRPPGIKVTSKSPKTARKSLYQPKITELVRTFEFRKKTTRSPLEMLEMKRRQEEAIYDLHEQQRRARLIHLRQKRHARMSPETIVLPCSSDEEESSTGASDIKPCFVLLNDFVKKLKLDGMFVSGFEDKDAGSSPFSLEYEDDENDEDWYADLEDVEEEDDDYEESKESNKRPHIPRLKLKRVMKYPKLKGLKTRNLVSQLKSPLEEPLKLVIKTEPDEPQNKSEGAEVDRTGFAGSYLDFLKERPPEGIPYYKPRKLKLSKTSSVAKKQSPPESKTNQSSDTSVNSSNLAHKANFSSEDSNLTSLNVGDASKTQTVDSVVTSPKDDEKMLVLNLDASSHKESKSDDQPMINHQLTSHEETDATLDKNAIAQVDQTAVKISDSKELEGKTEEIHSSVIIHGDVQDVVMISGGLKVKTGDSEKNSASKEIMSDPRENVTDKNEGAESSLKICEVNESDLKGGEGEKPKENATVNKGELQAGSKVGGKIGESNSKDGEKDGVSNESEELQASLKIFENMEECNSKDEAGTVRELTSGTSVTTDISGETVDESRTIEESSESSPTPQSSNTTTNTNSQETGGIASPSNNNNNNEVKACPPLPTPDHNIPMTSPVHSTSEESLAENKISKLKVITPQDRLPSSFCYTCKRCGFFTSTKLNIESHIYSHIPGVKFRCALCQSEFSPMTSAASHLKNTHAPADHKLLVTGYVDEANFYDKTDASVAAIDHESSNNSRSLTSQISTGSGGQSPPFIISVVVSGGSATNRTVRAGNTTRRFVCSHCGFATNVKEDVEQHVSDLHSSQGLFACSLCNESVYSSEEAIKQHSVSVHPSRPKPYRKLPDFYNAAHLAKMEKQSGQEDLGSNVISVLNVSDADSSSVDHKLKAKEYLDLQEDWKGKKSAEADSTTAADFSEDNSMELDSSGPDADALEGSSVESTAATAVPVSPTKGVEEEMEEQHQTTCIPEETTDIVDALPQLDDGDNKEAEEDSLGMKIVEVVSLCGQQTDLVEEEGDDIQAMKPLDEDSSNCEDQMNESSVTPIATSDSANTTDKSSSAIPMAMLSSASLPDKPQSSTTSSGTESSILLSPITQETPLPTERRQSAEKSTSVTAGPSIAPSTQSCPKDSENQAVVPAAAAISTTDICVLSSPQPQLSSSSASEISSSVTSSTSAPLSSPDEASSSAPSLSSSFMGGLPLSYKCKACKVHTPYLLMMVKHLKSRHPLIRCFSCPYCKFNSSFISQKQLRHHVKSQHPAMVDKNEVSLSKEAKKLVEAMVLPSSSQCTRVGNRLVLEEDIHTCTLCALRMTSLSSVYDHLNETHSDLFEFVCPVCQAYKNKSLQNISLHCSSQHGSKLDKDKVHVSVPKYLFTILSCISNNGKYIEKALMPEASSTPKSPSATTKAATSAPSGVEAASTSSAVSGGNNETTQEERTPNTNAIGMPKSSTTPSHVQQGNISDNLTGASLTSQQHASLAFALSTNVTVMSSKATIPARPLYSNSNQRPIISSALFDTSSLVPVPAPVTNITTPSTAHQSSSRPSSSKSPRMSSLPVLNVPTVKARSSSSPYHRQPQSQQSPGPSTPKAMPPAPYNSKPILSPTDAEHLPENEPNPDAFKIFNLRPSLPPTPVMPAAPSTMSGVPSVFPPVSSSSIALGFIPGPMAGFPAAMVIPPNLVHSAFPFAALRPGAPSSGNSSTMTAVASSLNTAFRPVISNPPGQQPRSGYARSSTAPSASKVRNKAERQRVHQGSSPQLSHHNVQPAHQRPRHMSLGSLGAVAATNFAPYSLGTVRVRQPPPPNVLPLEHLHQLQQQQYVRDSNWPPQFQIRQPAAGASFSMGGQPSLSSTAFQSQQSSPSQQQQQSQETPSPSPGNLAPTTASQLAKKGKRSSQLYQCPYCTVELRALDVASHIHQLHPGRPVTFRKVV